MRVPLLAYGLAVSLAAWLLTGCSFRVDVGYHGRTGVDNRTQSALVPASSGAEAGNERTIASKRY